MIQWCLVQNEKASGEPTDGFREIGCNLEFRLVISRIIRIQKIQLLIQPPRQQHCTSTAAASTTTASLHKPPQLADHLQTTSSMPASNNDASSSAAFARHTKEVTQQQPDASADSTAANSHPLGHMSLKARFLVFIFVPTITGLTGYFTAYMKAKNGKPVDDKEELTVDFDRDFLTPFLLSMALVVVIGFQTRGYSTNERKAAFQWPKTRRVRTVRRERVIVDDDEGATKKDN